MRGLDIHGNSVTEAGYGYLAEALAKINQSITIVFTKAQEISKEALKQTIKSMLYIAKQNGISTKEMLTTDETIEHCKKGAWNVTKNIVSGVVKCFTKASTPLAVYEMDMHSLLVDATTNVINPLKKPMQFICFTENTVFSVVDEEFGNCLVGVDSLLDN